LTIRLGKSGWRMDVFKVLSAARFVHEDKIFECEIVVTAAPKVKDHSGAWLMRQRRDGSPPSMCHAVGILPMIATEPIPPRWGSRIFCSIYGPER